MTRTALFAGVMTVLSTAALAQTPASGPVTRPGHDFNLSVQHYDYTEPMDLNISIHAPKVGAEYTGTVRLSDAGRWFGQFNLRGTIGNTAYDGWCRPWQIVPSSTSANGYRLTLGTASACSETGDFDWYADGRLLMGKDLVGASMSVSPFTGVGFRYLSNGTTGHVDFRTDEYLYVPIGLTLRTAPNANHVLGLTVEYDHLLRGWQQTRDSLLGGGTVPATVAAPSFIIGDFTDFAFDQKKGMAFRASASYAVGRWSVEPYYTRWRVDDSPIATGSVAYVVNAITVRQTLNAYEPLNMTNEFGVKLGVHLGGR